MGPKEMEYAVQWALRGAEQVQREKDTERVALIAQARLMVTTLKALREKGEFFALHPQALTDSLQTLESMLSRLSASYGIVDPTIP